MSNSKRVLGVFGGAPLSESPIAPFRPCFPDLDEFINPFSSALKSGLVTNNGSSVQEFEKKLEDYFDAPVAVFNNGQSALMIMLRAAGVRSGEVIVPSYTFAGTAHAVSWCGATPVFCDLENHRSLTMSASQVEKLINDKTVAILGVDVHGIACDYKQLDRLGKRYDIPVLYDSAQAFGTRVDNQVIGAKGQAQMFSFHATKSFSTMEGGCIVSRDPELMARARTLRNFGQETNTDCFEPGQNGKMLEICALIGIGQLKSFEEAARHRVDIAKYIIKNISTVNGINLPEVPGNQVPVWFNFPIIVDEDIFGLTRDELVRALQAENIEVRKYFETPCHKFSCYATTADRAFPHTDYLSSRVASLPIYSDLRESECDTIIQAIADIGAQAAQVKDFLNRETGS